MMRGVVGGAGFEPTPQPCNGCALPLSYPPGLPVKVLKTPASVNVVSPSQPSVRLVVGGLSFRCSHLLTVRTTPMPVGPVMHANP
jgi:hypothetical protein